MIVVINITVINQGNSLMCDSNTYDYSDTYDIRYFKVMHITVAITVINDSSNNSNQ